MMFMTAKENSSPVPSVGLYVPIYILHDRKSCSREIKNTCFISLYLYDVRSKLDEFLYFSNIIHLILIDVSYGESYDLIFKSLIFFPMAQQPLVGQGVCIIEASRSHSFRHTKLGRTPLNE